MQRQKVEVTNYDIMYGFRGSAKYCPVARALTRAGFEDAEVHGYEFYYRGGNALLPSEVATFINDFDSQEFVYPISFIVEY